MTNNTQLVKEANFAFFNVGFSKSKELTTNGTLDLNYAVEKFSLLFEKTSLPIKDHSSNKDFPNHIVKVEENVFLITLHKERTIKYINKEEDNDGRVSYNEDEINSYPYHYMVVDNRDNKSQIAFGFGGRFGNNIDKVVRLMELVSNQWMNDYGVMVDISEARIPMKFWTYYDQCINDGHRLLRLKIGFKNPKKTKINSPNLRSNIKAMLQFVENTGGDRSMLTVDAPSAKEGKMMLDRRMKDMAQIVGLCSSNDFYLELKFKGLEAYKYSGDENVKAIFPMPGNAITEMIESEDNPQQVIQWAEGTKRAVVLWLDNVHDKIYDYECKAAKHKPRNKANNS